MPCVYPAPAPIMVLHEPVVLVYIDWKPNATFSFPELLLNPLSPPTKVFLPMPSTLYPALSPIYTP